jgi:hypothetical protein
MPGLTCIDDGRSHFRHDQDETKVDREFHPGPIISMFVELLTQTEKNGSICGHLFNILELI